jgi:hypothetical protein
MAQIILGFYNLVQCSYDEYCFPITGSDYTDFVMGRLGNVQNEHYND